MGSGLGLGDLDLSKDGGLNVVDKVLAGVGLGCSVYAR